MKDIPMSEPLAPVYTEMKTGLQQYLVFILKLFPCNLSSVGWALSGRAAPFCPEHPQKHLVLSKGASKPRLPLSITLLLCHFKPKGQFE